MKKFTNPLALVQIGGHKFSLIESFSYEDVTVREGFETDLASIPRILWTLLDSPIGRHAQAAVLHDFLYSAPLGYNYSRKECDQIFLRAMKDSKVDFWRRWLIYFGVRLFGFFSFQKR